jgi:deoxyribodipyrimidine photo-lyase
MSNVAPITVVWFKRDLRWTDHAPLRFAAARGGVVALWVYEPSQWACADAAPQHLAFANECLDELDQWCASLGGTLTRMHGDMLEVLDALRNALGAFTLVSHEETGNAWSYERDKSVKRWCEGSAIEWREFPNNAVVRRLASRNRWTQHWNTRMANEPLDAPAAITWVSALASVPTVRAVGTLDANDLQRCGCDKPDRVRGGRSVGVENLRSFLVSRGQHYRVEMSSPLTAYEACSRVSAHLAWGALSIRECIHAVNARRNELRALPRDQVPPGFLASLKSFEARLHWHCHFIQKLEDEPAIEWRNVHRGFDQLRNEAQLVSELSAEEVARYEAFCEARTGFPFVDACLRSLAHTGWINFRMRAMLMSFASYNLWLHWRLTGLHLAREFTDYEPGIHWSQSQMQSGVTGINTVRIYNVVKQSIDQDPSGEFIRRWVPELADVPDKYIHTPWKATDLPMDYPARIVDHMQSMRDAKEKIYMRKRAPEVKLEAKQVYEKHGSRNPAREGVRRRSRAAAPSHASAENPAFVQMGLFESEQ